MWAAYPCVAGAAGGEHWHPVCRALTWAFAQIGTLSDTVTTGVASGVTPRSFPTPSARVANARAALAALDSTARQLPNPKLLRRPSLRREAQSTSALEGTYEPLQAVLTADDEGPTSLTMREVLNFCDHG